MDLHYNLQLFQKLNKRYQSELSFLHDEVMFLRDFLKTSFPAMFSESRVTRAQLLHQKLMQLKLAQENAILALLVHQENLYSSINSAFAKSNDFLKIENERLGDEIKDLNNNFKRIKQEIFSFYKDATASNLQAASASEELQLD